jgi:hypothetical protein
MDLRVLQVILDYQELLVCRDILAYRGGREHRVFLDILVFPEQVDTLGHKD